MVKQIGLCQSLFFGAANWTKKIPAGQVKQKVQLSKFWSIVVRISPFVGFVPQVALIESFPPQQFGMFIKFKCFPQMFAQRSEDNKSTLLETLRFAANFETIETKNIFENIQI